jgi:hypothetical protein
MDSFLPISLSIIDNKTSDSIITEALEFDRHLGKNQMDEYYYTIDNKILYIDAIILIYYKNNKREKRYGRKDFIKKILNSITIDYMDDRNADINLYSKYIQILTDDKIEINYALRMIPFRYCLNHGL